MTTREGDNDFCPLTEEEIMKWFKVKSRRLGKKNIKYKKIFL